MAFDPTSAYVIVVDIDGKRYARQSTTYYDMYGNGFTALPGSVNGYHAPTDPTLVAAITSGTISGAAITSSSVAATTLSASTRFGVLSGAGITASVGALTSTGAPALSSVQVFALSTSQISSICTNNDLIVTALREIGVAT